MNYAFPLPHYKSYGPNECFKDYQIDIKSNAKNNIARAVVVTADRLVSVLNAEDLKMHIEQNTLKN